MNNKYYLRNFYKTKIENSNFSSDKIKLNVINYVNNISCRNTRKFIGIYCPLRWEVDIRELTFKTNIKFALPFSFKNKKIEYFPWRKNILRKDHCGLSATRISKPLPPCLFHSIIVPALAVDKYGYRLGYGGGFFDRLRARKNWKAITAIVVAPKCVLTKKVLPRDYWDIPFDGYINEDGFFKTPLVT